MKKKKKNLTILIYIENIKFDIKEFIINNVIGYGPITALFDIAKDGLNDVIVNTKDYVDIIYKGNRFIP